MTEIETIVALKYAPVVVSDDFLGFATFDLDPEPVRQRWKQKIVEYACCNAERQTFGDKTGAAKTWIDITRSYMQGKVSFEELSTVALNAAEVSRLAAEHELSAESAIEWATAHTFSEKRLKWVEAKMASSSLTSARFAMRAAMTEPTTLLAKAVTISLIASISAKSSKEVLSMLVEYAHQARCEYEQSLLEKQND